MVAKRPSGTLETMIPITKTSASKIPVPIARRIIRKITPKVTATAVTIWTKWLISTFNGEISLPRPLAIKDDCQQKEENSLIYLMQQFDPSQLNHLFE